MLTVRTVAVTPIQSNCHLVADPASREAVLVDPGDYSDEVAALIADGGFRVTRIFLTHGHFDHVLGATAAARALRAPLWLHAADLPQLSRLGQMAAMFGMGDGAPPRIDHQPADGERFTLGAEEAQVIHTPGHSPGGACLWFPASKILVTGDTLFEGSVGRTDLPGGDWGTIVASIRGKLFPLGDDVRFYPGHGPSALLGDERRGNPFVGDGARAR
jgi:glyoxylase-like metal-dependent hydrolase (beta-lactamase superfamily II)